MSVTLTRATNGRPLVIVGNPVDCIETIFASAEDPNVTIVRMNGGRGFKVVGTVDQVLDLLEGRTTGTSLGDESDVLRQESEQR